MNESETRAEYIDPKLKNSGWGEIEGAKSCGRDNECFRNNEQVHKEQILQLPYNRIRYTYE